VIRRVYRLAPVIGATKEELREWSIEEIAKEAGVPVKRIESIIEETKVFWARKCNERSLVTRAVEAHSRGARGSG
jgi:anaerobic selenocysteine-containing dehydrogenase